MSATATSPRRRTAPARPPRRISGPVGGGARVAAAARAATMPRESIALSERALALVRGLPDHSLIDRLVRGRAWIPVLGVLLAGIVAMQVEILKLGSSMGRSVERTALLQTENESLRAGVAGLLDDQRIERLAAGMGMAMPKPESLVFLQPRPGGGVGRALANIHAPDPTGFINQLTAQAAAAAALTAPAPAATTPSATPTGSPGVTSGATSAVAPASTPTVATAPVTSTPTAAATSAPAPSQATPTTGTSSSTAPSPASGTGGGASVSPVAAPPPGASTGG